jgi:CDP-2,3-bis-(O-geranylgeranyl)-sn-glycerol synthase
MDIGKILMLLYIALPAFVANMLPVIAAKQGWLKIFDVPLDNGRTWRGYPLLGPGKTLRGLIVGVSGATAVAGVQYLLSGFVPWLPVFGSWPLALIFGFTAGFGALAGDAAASFLKRRIGVKRGRPFIPFDQIDYIFGFLLFTSAVVSWQWPQALFLLAFAFIANPLTNLTAYALKIKSTCW